MQDKTHTLEGKESALSRVCFGEMVSFFRVYSNKVIWVFTGLRQERSFILKSVPDLLWLRWASRTMFCWKKSWKAFILARLTHHLTYNCLLLFKLIEPVRTKCYPHQVRVPWTLRYYKSVSSFQHPRYISIKQEQYFPPIPSALIPWNWTLFRRKKYLL